MIERLAVAVFRAHAEKTAKGKAAWHEAHPHAVYPPPSDFPLTPEEAIRAVLEALREPSEAMVAAGICTRHEQEVPEAWNKATVNVWQAMIDAALS
jgi:hypothetical protein